MSVLHSDDFESGSLAGYPHVVNCSVASDATLGGTRCVVTGGGLGPGVLGIGQFDYNPLTSEFDWGTTPLPASGRAFTLAACFDNSYLPWVGGWDPNGLAFMFGRNPPHPDTPYRALLELNRLAHDSGTVSMWLWHPGRNTYIGLNTTSPDPAIIELVIGPRNTPMTIRIVGEMATITGGDINGGGTAANDGWVSVYVDGVLTFHVEDYPLGFHINNQGPPEYHDTYPNVPNAMQWAETTALGRLKNWYVADDLDDPGLLCGVVIGGTPPEGTGTPGDLETPDTPPFGNCAPCPGTTTPGTVPDPIGALPPWSQACTSGGHVDTVADLADGEDWAA